MPRALRVKDIYTGRRALLDESEYNEQVKRWSAATQQLAKQAASAFHHGKRRNRTYQSGPKAGKTERRLRNTIQYGLKASYGDIAAIGFQFERHGIFLEYGVSRGHPKSGIRRSMSDWFSASLDRQERKLLDIVSEHQADKYLHTFMGIKK